MAQLNLYVPDEVARKLRRAAKKAGKSLSAYVLERVEARPARSRWPKDFLDLEGSWEGEFPQVEDLPPDESLPFGDEAATAYGIVRAQLRREGRPIGGNDLMIAAIALASDATVVTRNDREFRRVGGLRVEGW